MKKAPAKKTKRKTPAKKQAVAPVSIPECGMNPPVESSIVPRHQWTNGGAEVLCVKCVSSDGLTYGGFRWPLTVGAEVVAADWNTTPECGGGLHGWPWGFSIGDGKEPNWSATWLVFGALPADVVDLGGKCKAQRGTIRYVGDWQGATAFVLAGQMAWVFAASRGAASATGGSGAASATGGSGAASATGESSIAAVTGIEGRVRGGSFGAIALAWWNDSAKRREMRCAEIGVGDGTDGKLKSNQWYRLDAAGTFVEVKS
jgi:hypothetical protein